MAALLIGAAVSYGLLQRDKLEATAHVQSVVTPLPAVYIAVGPEAPNPQRTTAVQTPFVPQPTLPQMQPPAFGQAPGVGVGAAANPGVNVPLAPISPGTARGSAFTALRAALIQKFGVMPLPVHNAGFAIAVEGVRVEADTAPDWSISLYNHNPAVPTTQTDNFKSALNLVVANLELDLTAQPNTGADGRQTLRTNSKLGRVSMITDPVMGNSVVVKPLQKKAQIVQPVQAGQPIPAQPFIKPQQPIAPVAPVAPPKPPPVEQF